MSNPYETSKIIFIIPQDYFFEYSYYPGYRFRRDYVFVFICVKRLDAVPGIDRCRQPPDHMTFGPGKDVMQLPVAPMRGIAVFGKFVHALSPGFELRNRAHPPWYRTDV